MVPSVSGGIMKKKKWTLMYPNIPPALLQVLHGEGISVPKPPKEFTIDSEDKDKLTLGSPEPPATSEPHILTKDKLNDLVRDLELSKSKAELLGSRRKQWNLLEKMSEFLNFEVVISSWCLFQKVR
jgi:hypothetical protein